MYGYDHPDDPIGPEPAREAPDQRAAWHQAFAALGRSGQSDIRTIPNGRLWLLRDAYTAETAWAPRHAGKELRHSRLGAFDAGLSAIRAAAEAQAARKAGDHARAERHEHLAASYRSLRDLYQQREQAFTQAMAGRQEWEQATARSRRLAIAADAELRRRHPGQRIESLRSAEPAVSGDDRQHPDPIPRQRTGETTPIRDLEVQRQAPRAAEAYPDLRPPWRDAILQPPRPQITPSAQIPQLTAEHDIEPEAGG